MKLWIMSDLHTEFAEVAWRPKRTPQHDVLVAAGDIASSPARAIKYLQTLTDRPIVFVLGNHEFYGKPWRKTLQLARDAVASAENVHFLENNAVTIGGTRFLGATLWTDFAVNGRPAWDARSIRRVMTDFQTIRVEGLGRLSPAQWLERHRNSVAWLESALLTPFAGPTIVVTHHAPHKGSIHSRFDGDPFSAGFVSHLPKLVERTPLWVHGHVHDPFDYRVGRSRVVCNPLGYPGEHDGFNEALVISLAGGLTPRSSRQL